MARFRAGLRVEGEVAMREQVATKKSLFLSAIEIETREQRRAFLDQSCATDPELRREVEALLEAHDRLGPVENESETEAIRSDAQAGSVIGSYKLLEQIGEGGMAAVFLAEQKHPIARKVALKLIKPGMDSRHVIARFEAERQALALMDHPNIARVLDAGTSERGQPYFVMELVKGVPITRYCDEHRLSPRDRLELFVQVCQAVQHAHQKGIIHRDIKPSNVLIALYDGKPVPKVIDFGVAKAMGQQLTDRTMFTGFGAIIGTLEYMSPEQAELNQLDIDTRSDIYSLGVLLYELLTGTTPLEHGKLKRTALDEVLRTIRQEEPPKPSTRLSTLESLPSIAAQRALDPKKLTSVVRGELDWIVMKALEKDRGRRYQTANALAMDIERYLRDETVLACPPSASYRLRKLARRHVTALLAAVGVFGGLVVIVVGLAISNVRVARERNEKAAALRDAQTQRERAERNFVEARQAVASLMAQPAGGMGEWSTMPIPLRKKFAEEAVKFYNSLLEQGTADASLQYETAIGYRSIGFLHYKFGEYPEAEKLTRQSLDVLEWLNQQDPKKADYRQQIAWSRMQLGWILNLTNRAAEAEASLRQAAGLQEQLLAENPKHQSYGNEIAECYFELSRTCVKQWAALDDRQFRERALALPASLSANLPHICVVNDQVATALGRRGMIDDALPMHRAALADLDKLAEYPLSSHSIPNMRLDFHASQAETLVTGMRSAEAIKLIESDVATAPDDGLVHGTLGHIHARLGQWDRAAAAYDRSIELKPPDAQVWYGAAGVYLARDDAQAYRRVCAGMLERASRPSVPVTVVEMTLRTCTAAPGAVEDFAAVERLADRLIRATEGKSQSRVHLLAKGMVEVRAGRAAQAVQWLDRFAPDPQGGEQDAVAFAAMAISQQQLGDGDAARASLAKARAIVAGKMPDPAKGKVFEGSTYADWQHCRVLIVEAEKHLTKPTTQRIRG